MVSKKRFPRDTELIPRDTATRPSLSTRPNNNNYSFVKGN